MGFFRDLSGEKGRKPNRTLGLTDRNNRWIGRTCKKDRKVASRGVQVVAELAIARYRGTLAGCIDPEGRTRNLQGLQREKGSGNPLETCFPVIDEVPGGGIAGIFKTGVHLGMATLAARIEVTRANWHFVPGS